MARHVSFALVPEDPVERRLGSNAVRSLGMQGIRPPPKAHQDMTPTGAVPKGLGEGVHLVPGHPFGGEDLPCGNALANQDTHTPGWRILNPTPGTPRAPPRTLRTPRPRLGHALLVTQLEIRTPSARHSATSVLVQAHERGIGLCHGHRPWVG